MAVIGIGVPIALSFILHSFLNITPLQAFAAGAALCSTSLGTTFTVLSTSGLTESRLGVVLTSAAMMDDVIGLVMVQVIANLGGTSFDPVTVVRPICVSIAFAIVAPLLCVYLIKPLASHIRPSARLGKHDRVRELSTTAGTTWTVHTASLLAAVTASSYAGTSNLFAAYLVGACISWFDSLDLSPDQVQSAASPTVPVSAEACSRDVGQADYATPMPELPPAVNDVPAPIEALRGNGKARSIGSARKKDATDPEDTQNPRPTPPQHSSAEASHPTETSQQLSPHANTSGMATYEQYYAAVNNYVLKPFFFASIGFSIPVSDMFTGAIVWRGFIYAALMVLGKLVCGLCLVRLDISGASVTSISTLIRSRCRKATARKEQKAGTSSTPFTTTAPMARAADAGTNSAARSQVAVSSMSPSTAAGEARQPGMTGASVTDETDARVTADPVNVAAAPALPTKIRPLSLYPAAILGSAMIARGEIGFLISAIAESSGVYGATTTGQSSELFLVVTWAILLNTILGPVTVGVLVKRVRRLQELERSKETGRDDPLGQWGIVRT